MATVKNFGLAGVSSDVQWGKSGGRITFGSNEFNIRNSDNSAFIQLNVPLTPTSDQHATSKQYVDSVATGLNIKAAVRAATVSASEIETAFTYQNAADDNTTATPLVWTSTGLNTPVFDGITLADGDRVLVDAATDQRGNGIFTYSADADGSGNSGFRRTSDADNTPGNEVAGGMLVPVLEGDTHGADQHVLVEPTGVATLGTDNLVFSTFTSASNFVGGDGINISAQTISADADEVTITATGGAGTELAVRSTATAGQVLRSSGVAGDDATWGALDLDNANATSGSLGINRGGTNLSTIADRSILRSNAADTLAALTVTPNSKDQLLLWDDSADDFTFVDADTVGTSYGVINGDSGTANASGTADTINFIGATNGGVTTAAADGAPDSVTFALTLNDLSTGGATLALGDFIAVNDSGDGAGVTAQKYTFTDVVEDLDIPNAISSNGLVTRTAADTYASRSIAASVVAGDEGISIVNGDGAAGDPTVGLDITGLVEDTTVAGTEFVVLYNGTNNVKTSVANLIAGGAVAWTSISDGSTTANADISSDTLTFTGQDGISAIVSDDPETITFELDITSLTGTNAITGADEMVFDDNASGTHIKRTVSNFLDDLNVVNNLGGNGIAVQTAADTYVARSIAASVVAGDEGISVVDGDGVGGNPTIGLDITGLTLDTAVQSTDELVIYNGTNNVKTTVGALFTDIEPNSISEGNSSVTVTDAGIGSVTTVIDGSTILTVDGSGITNIAGSESAPSYNFTGETDSGMYHDGTNVCITDDGTDVACFQGVASAVNGFLFVNSATGTAIDMQATGDDTNIDIRLSPKGTGEVLIGASGSAGVIQADDDQSLTVKGGDESSTAGGDLILEGGDGSAGADGDVLIRPGTGGATDGEVCIQSGDAENIMCFDGVASAVNNFNVINAATGSGPQIQAEGSDSNIDIRFLPKGTGVLSVTGTTTYEDNVTDDDDIPNKKFVDDAIAAATTGSNAVQTVEWTVDLTSASTQTATDSIPAGARVLRVYFNVGTASDAATTVAIQTTGAAETLQATSENDPETTGLYQSDLFVSATAGAPEAVVTTAGSVGTATALVEFRT